MLSLSNINKVHPSDNTLQFRIPMNAMVGNFKPVKRIQQGHEQACQLGWHSSKGDMTLLRTSVVLTSNTVLLLWRTRTIYYSCQIINLKHSLFRYFATQSVLVNEESRHWPSQVFYIVNHMTCRTVDISTWCFIKGDKSNFEPLKSL